MKKSKKVPATLVTAVAALIVSGCHSSNLNEVRRCVDSQGNVIPDSVCSGTSTGLGTGFRPGYRYFGTPHWAYGGSMSGSRLSGSHNTPSEGASVSDSGGHTISRGGFGGHGGSAGS